jgi:hypothetical protein
MDQAFAEGLLEASLRDDPLEAWKLLQYRAPQGWFKKVNQELTTTSPDPHVVPEPENLGALVQSLTHLGLTVSLVDLSNWTPAERREALAFTRGEVKTFAKLASIACFSFDS